ncbi:alpha/beta-hydrolase [Auriculariales sp. MPI-PUGE-AT-0066]|nr:alpha/beta-hydrolase [Auriculariales sp. MPI-PUGE-AT-0066]
MSSHLDLHLGMRKKQEELPCPTLANNSALKQPASNNRLLTRKLVPLAVLSLCIAWFCLARLPQPTHENGRLKPASFFWTRNNATEVCPGANGAKSYSGFIGLNGDNEASPRRSFYWYFEAQRPVDNAPVILTHGGGPGISGLMNPLWGQSHCKLTKDGPIPNPNAWSENFHLVALDHPIGAGFSYGTSVNNTRASAHDVYDFLQKFFILHPHLASRPLVLTSGSYGGTYVPHIATVINERNKEVADGHGPPRAQRLNLQAVMISNPVSDYYSYNEWLLHQACYETNYYNATQCMPGSLSITPKCLDTIQYAYSNDVADNRRKAVTGCSGFGRADGHDRAQTNYKLPCPGGDEFKCNPEFDWADKLLNNATTKRILGVPLEHRFKLFADDVAEAFGGEGDIVQQPYLLHTQLLADGVRVLHYLGQLDNTCGPPATVSFLRSLPSQFHDEFRAAPDLPWNGSNSTAVTVRAVGPGAGNLTMLLIAEAGHFVVKDQPALVKKIVTHWLKNEDWFSL